MSSLNSSKSFLAWVVAAYSIGEAFGALFLGYATAFLDTRRSMVAAAAMGAVGSLLYMVASHFPQGGLGLSFIFLGRFAQGVWTGGSQAIQTAYLGRVLPIWELTPTIVTLRASASLGFILGPVFGLALDFIPLNLQDRLAAPGGFVLISAISMAFLFGKVFNGEGDQASSTEESNELDESTDVILPTERDPLLDRCGSKQEFQHNLQKGGDRELFWGLFTCNLTVFSLFGGFVIQETITT